MTKDLFNRYIWLVDTIYRAGRISFEEINQRWRNSGMSNGEDMALRTFHHHRHAIEEIFDINIECDKRNGYCYYIENADDIEKGGIRNWLLNTFAVNNLINESHHLKHRILFEQIPSCQKFLTPIIEAMRDSTVITITYQSFWKEHPNTFVLEPYCVKIFKQRWYMLANNCPRPHSFSYPHRTTFYPSGRLRCPGIFLFLFRHHRGGGQKNRDGTPHRLWQPIQIHTFVAPASQPKRDRNRQEHGFQDFRIPTAALFRLRQGNPLLRRRDRGGISLMAARHRSQHNPQRQRSIPGVK